MHVDLITARDISGESSLIINVPELSCVDVQKPFVLRNSKRGKLNQRSMVSRCKVSNLEKLFGKPSYPRTSFGY